MNTHNNMHITRYNSSNNLSIATNNRPCNNILLYKIFYPIILVIIFLGYYLFFYIYI